MRRAHEMPFGASVLPGGGVRFRLWAPDARRVGLEVSAPVPARILAMRAREGGWFEAVVPEVREGARYAFRIDGRPPVPDPASRANPDDVHAPSRVVDPRAFEWRDGAWRGRPWEEAVVYELHVGTFTPAGTFAAATERLDHLADLGVTAVELMPVADFPGSRGWGYDGVLPFAPEAGYGTPEDLKRLVEAAHARGLMVLLDVVYNHFGPEGNHLGAYASAFFDPGRRTPWGAAIDFDPSHGANVRAFFVHNALYWLEEFHFDGLRLDAVHAIADESRPDIVEEIARAVREGPGRRRHVHLVLENDRNQARYLARDDLGRPTGPTAQWNDDVHHALHVLATGETDGYYADYAAAPLRHLGRCLAEGFAWQGEPSPYREGESRGEPSAHLPPTAFVDFLQTHDQVGNRAFGERIGALAPAPAVDAMLACLLLAPSVPMLFMGEEFDASTPFLFFCDFGAELATAVTQGRRREFARFLRFREPEARARIPDPNDPASFEASKLRWEELSSPGHRERHALCRRLLELRRVHVVPGLAGVRCGGAFEVRGEGVLAVHWTLGDGARLHLLANLAPERRCSAALPGEPLFPDGDPPREPRVPGALAPWAVAWSKERARG